MKKQVDKSHYRFAKYLHSRRWASMWHQIDEVLRFDPGCVLEVGPGAGVFKAVCEVLGVAVETADIDPELGPDYICSVLDLPFEDAAFDVTCAFQMLEHIPFEDSMRALAELGRTARNGVVVSLPDADPAWPTIVTLPRFGQRSFLLRKPFFRPKEHVFRGEHYWEINKKGYSLAKVISAFATISALRLRKTYRVPQFPYHRFFVFEKRTQEAVPTPTKHRSQVVE